MGACLSLDEEERKAKYRSEKIDQQLQSWNQSDRGVIKILLLGAGESGKSTLVKQMKIIHDDGFTFNELLSFKPTVLDNLVASMKFVLSGMGLLRINLDNSKNRHHAQAILACHRPYDERQNMYHFMSSALHALWSDAGVRRAVSRGYEYELNDSAIYYFENMSRICSEKYCPNQTDVLRARVRTTGVLETCFRMKHLVFRMFDVGGQRTERNKWIQCFDDVRALLFVTALSGYDMTLYEDPSVNRMDESLRLFRQICNNPFFSHTTLILFLNKLDLFRDKILHSQRHLKYYFHDFKGPDYDVEKAAIHIEDMFRHQLKRPKTELYSHFTTATDTNNIQVVFQAVMQTIVSENLAAAQLL